MAYAAFVVIGIVAGWLAGRVMRGNGFGLFGDVLVGVAGAFGGAFLFGAVGVELAGVLFGRLAGAVIGAVVLLFAVRLFTGRRGGRRVWS